MPKKPQVYKQIRFDLYPDDQAEARLLKFLQTKAARGRMRTWIVSVLLQALEGEKP